MPEVSSGGVRIRYDVVGEGRPLVLLHGWGVDRSSWADVGYVDSLRSDHRLVIIDLRGSGASDKPHEADAYTADHLTADVLAVADAEGLDRFALWGHSWGGWISWMTAAAHPARVATLVTWGAWDPRPEDGPTEDGQKLISALRQEGMSALVEPMRKELGERFDREFPPALQAVTLRADPQALAAAYSMMWVDGISDADLGSFPVSALLIAGELEDPDDDAAKIAATIPNGERLRLPGLGHEGTCNASSLTVPIARAFLDRWFATT